MKSIPQYVTKDGRRFYYSNEAVHCCKCDIHITEFIIIVLEWGRKKSEVLELCVRCSKKHRQTGLLQEKFVMCLTNKKPFGSSLELMSRPELITNTKDDSLFCNSLDVPRVNNKATRSGHPDYTVLDDSAPVIMGLPIDKKHEGDRQRLIRADEDIKRLIK